MGIIHNPLPAKLFIGMLSPDQELIAECSGVLCDQYGMIDLESEIQRWDTTDYYREEMGGGIFRKFIFFSGTADPGILPSVKISTNRIEERFAEAASGARRRRINIDPGYITEAKVVLASTKDFAHRLYIGDNIYAEVTLRYSSVDSSFVSLDHTYFDFRSEEYRNMFNRARDLLRTQLNRNMGKTRRQSL